MSGRPIAAKRVAGVRKMLRATPQPQIDLVDWLQTRGHAQTSGQARQIIKDGRVKSESHTLRNPRVPAHLRSTLRVDK